VLLLEVSEGPRTRISPPADASTLDLTGVEPRVQQLGEGRPRSEDLVSSRPSGPGEQTANRRRVPARALAGLDLCDLNRIRFHRPSGGASASSYDRNDFLTQMSHLRVRAAATASTSRLAKGRRGPRNGSDESVRLYDGAAACGVAAADFLVGDIPDQLHTCPCAISLSFFL